MGQSVKHIHTVSDRRTNAHTLTMVVDMLYMFSELRWHRPSLGCTIPARRPSRATWVFASEVKIRRWDAPARQPICSWFPSNHNTMQERSYAWSSYRNAGSSCVWLKRIIMQEKPSLYLAHRSLDDGIKASLRGVPVPGHHLLLHFLCEATHFLRQRQNVLVAKLGQTGGVYAIN